jgi:hypothetical protein
VLTVECNVPIACTGRLLLQSRKPRGARTSAVTTYARARLNLQPGQAKQLKPKLTKAGRRFMRGRTKRKLFANAKLESGGQRATASSRITLKRP